MLKKFWWMRLMSEEKTFLYPSFFASEKQTEDVYLLSITEANGSRRVIEASGISGNIFINKNVTTGFDNPETLEFYYDCNIEKIFIERMEDNRVFIDIYVSAH